VFLYDSVSGTWHQEAKLLASDGEGGDCFGHAVSLSGTRALVGARKDEFASGSAYLFAYDSGSGNWYEEAKLRASDAADSDFFGVSVSLSGDKALIGAWGDEDNGPFSGSVFAYDFTSTLSLDVKCNGQDQNVIVGSGENVTVTVDIKNGYHPGLEGDLWIIAVLPTSGWNTWTYGPWMHPFWRLGVGNVYYSGPPLNHAATVFDQPGSPGTYKVYLALDTVPDGILDLSTLWGFDVVDFTVQ